MAGDPSGFVQRLLTAPLARLAARLQLEPASITGLVVTTANCIPTLLSLDTLEERGITLNTAYAVVAAYSVGDFLAFTLQFSPAHALPMMAGRLLSGLLAVVLCLKTTPKTT
ncbi:ethanolamine utilization protein EutH [Gemmiger sp.]|uniref:ethanolamine utilization protein EutH n=1 Tax=Gemmiger sp. TaxID=2049027 RepID=UPI003AB88970